jgi:integrase
MPAASAPAFCSKFLRNISFGFFIRTLGPYKLRIIAESHVDTVQYFNRVVKQQNGVTFKEQSEIWLEQSQTRKRKPIRVTTIPTIQAALDKGILPEIGHLALYETAKFPAMKALLVAKMNTGGLSARTVNSYFRVTAAVVESAEDVEGNSLYPHKWDASKLDLPIVETSKQRRPSITAETMSEFARVKIPQSRMLLMLAASTGCRIGELLGLEIKDLLDDFTTVRIVQQAKGTRLTPELITATRRDSFTSPPKLLLWEFTDDRISGLVFPSRTGKPLNQLNIRNRVIHPLLNEKPLPLGGNHFFRRLRMT